VGEASGKAFCFRPTKALSRGGGGCGILRKKKKETWKRRSIYWGIGLTLPVRKENSPEVVKGKHLAERRAVRGQVFSLEKPEK